MGATLSHGAARLPWILGVSPDLLLDGRSRLPTGNSVSRNYKLSVELAFMLTLTGLDVWAVPITHWHQDLHMHG